MVPVALFMELLKKVRFYTFSVRLILFGLLQPMTPLYIRKNGREILKEGEKNNEMRCLPY